MKKSDHLSVKALQRKHHSAVERLIHPYEYRYHRYGLESIVLFLYLSEDQDISDYASYIRITDSFVMLEKHFYCIVYEGADIKQGIKAANNIKNRYEQEYSGAEFYMNAISVKKAGNRKGLVTFLFESLEQTVEKLKCNSVISVGSIE
jgi:hypothetical protein